MRHLFNYRTSSFGRFFKNRFKVLTARYAKIILAKASGTSLIKLLKKRRLLDGNSRETFPFFFSRSLIEFLKLEAIEYISEISTQDLNYFLKLCAFYCLLSEYNVKLVTRFFECLSCHCLSQNPVLLS